MTLTSKRDLEDYGLARVRDIAFDAVQKLWRRRREEGVTQKDLAETLGRDPSWISRQLSGPGNWTFRSFGALVEALDGEVEITVHPLEDPLEHSNNYDAYEYASELAKDYKAKLIKDHPWKNQTSFKEFLQKRHDDVDLDFNKHFEKWKFKKKLEVNDYV